MTKMHGLGSLSLVIPFGVVAYLNKQTIGTMAGALPGGKTCG